ncbi:MAG: FRG domain-containing protein [Pseudomonadota bacterium]|nr:FRG domain-containing protein [Pseudomonadota bacterium]
MEESYIERIPIWGKSDQNFEVMADRYSGRIPVTRIEHWQDFTSLLEDPFFNRPGTQFIYRGHRRWDWSLEPTLARASSNGLISQKLAERQLNHFRHATRGRITDHNLVLEDEEDELWSVGQHHGLMTPLLDWTYSPYVALFFAFAKENPPEEEDNPYRAVYILNKTFIDDNKRFPTIRVFEPKKDSYGRLVNQAGLFTFSPYDSTIETTLADVLGSEDFEDDEFRTASHSRNAEEEFSDEPRILAKYICKIYIRNEDREGCIRHLRRMNVHHASLFPDLIGAADYCNLIVAEEEKEYEIQKYARQLQNRLKALDNQDKEPLFPDSATVETASDRVTSVARTEPNLRSDIVAALNECEYGRSVEPGRTEAIATRLEEEVAKHKVVDWQSRESIQAKIRNAARVVLRDYGYPVDSREAVIERIFQLMLDRDKGE